MSSIINRNLVLIIPKQPFYDWANSFDDDLVMTPEDTNEHNSYLIYDEWEVFEKNEVIKPFFEEIFEEELFGMYTDPDGWPKKRDFETFCLWFDFHLSSLVYDMIEDEPLVHDAELNESERNDQELIRKIIEGKGKK